MKSLSSHLCRNYPSEFVHFKRKMKVSSGGKSSNVQGYVNELRVNVENYIFQWDLTGFNHVSFTLGHSVFSPSFILGTGSESVWQLLMAKTLKQERKGDVEDSENKINSESVEVVPESMDTEADLEPIADIPTPLAKDGSAVHPSDIEADSNSSLDSELTPEERLIGFRLDKAEEGSTWDVVKYHVELTVGDLTKSTISKIDTGSEYGKDREFLYVSQNDFEGLDFDNVEKVRIQVFIEYTYLDFYPLVSSSAKNEGQLTKDICGLFKSGIYSDVTLVAEVKKDDGSEEVDPKKDDTKEVETIKISAHKGILCARAFGFDCHLQEDSGFVKQKLTLHADECVARAMLAFIYCGGLPVEFPLEKCKALSVAADEYQVNGLKSFVEEFFKANLDSDVCNQCLNLGDSGLDSINLSEDQLRSILQKEGCSHKPEQKEKS